jgi:ubiquinone/menaquinone biosynthesis C-methylase UbiE
VGAPDVALKGAVAEYWDRRPCNAGHSRLPAGTREYFNQVEQRKYHVEPHLPQFASFANWRGKRVLEVGCGIGTETINFARAGAQVTAVDLSAASLEIAARRAEVFGLQERITFLKADAESLSSVVKPQAYDLVWSWGVLHHTPDAVAAIREIGKYLARGSELRLMVYAANSWKAAMIDAGLDQFEAQAGCPVARTFTDAELRELVRPLALGSVRIHQDHLFPYDVAAYIAGEYRLAPWFQCMAPKAFAAFEQNFGWHLMLRGIA